MKIYKNFIYFSDDILLNINWNPKYKQTKIIEINTVISIFFKTDIVNLRISEFGSIGPKITFLPNIFIKDSRP